MENFTNCTNCSGKLLFSSLSGPGFAVYLIILLIFTVFALGLAILATTLLCKVTSVAKILRILLISLLLSEMIVILFCGSIGIIAVMLNLTSIQPPNLSLCRVILWGYVVGTFTRLFNLAAFSLIVLLIVRYHKRQFKPLTIALCLAFVWIMPVILNLYQMVPPIYEVQYFDGVACFPAPVDAQITKEVRYTFTGLLFMFGGAFPIVISVAAPLIGLCFIRSTAESAYKKAIIKLSFLLLIGHINSIGQFAIGLITSYKSAPGVYIVYGLTIVSVITTPIIIILYLEQVRNKLAGLFKSHIRIRQPKRKASMITIECSLPD